MFDSAIGQELVNMIKAGIGRKTFSTGSKGFHTNGKISADGVAYQAQAQAVLIGSKGDPKAKAAASTEEITAALTDMVQAGIPSTSFKSGKSGYRAQGKVEAHGQRYQASVQAVRLS